MFATHAKHWSCPRIPNTHFRKWVGLSIFLVLTVTFSGCNTTSSEAISSKAISSKESAAAVLGMKSGMKSGMEASSLSADGADGFLIVDCLLPGQVKKLGSRFNYITQRSPIKTSAADCEIRGGEYVAYDRANYSTALKIWLPSAKEGDAKAQTYVGEIYEKGFGGTPDYQLAAYWYQKAADQSYSRAQINLGHLYELGLGVEADSQKAINYYRTASGMGDQLLFASTLSANYVPRERFETVKGELKEQLRHSEALKTRLETASANLNNQSAALSAAEKELTETTQKLEKLMTTQRFIPQGEAVKSAQAAELSSQIQQLTEHRDSLEQALNQLSTQKRSLEDNQATLNQQIADTKASKARYQQSFNEVQQQLTSSKQRLTQSQQELAQVRRQLAEERAKIADSAKTSEIDNPEIARLQQQLETKRTALAAEQRAYTALEAENLGKQKQLQETLTDITAETEQFTIANTKLGQEKSALQSSLADSNAQAAELQKQLLLSRAALETERAARAQSLSAQDEQHKKAMAERQQALSALSAQLEKQAELVKSQKQRIRATEEQTKQYEKDLAQVKAAAPQQAVAPQQVAAANPNPRIEIIEPPVVLTRSVPTVRLLTAEDERDIIGKISAPAGLLSLTVNGKSITPKSNNLFRSAIPIQNDVTPVEVVVVDNNGRRAALNFSFVTEAPGKTVATQKQPPSEKNGAKKSVEPDKSLGKFKNLSLGRYYALIIGNNDYRHLSTLETAVNDAKDADELLRSKYNFKSTLLLNADRYQMLSELNNLRKNLTETDNLLIYYAGHGKMDEASGRGYWLPIDAEENNNANWISNSEITDILNAIPARHILVVADSCYSGTLAPTPLARVETGAPTELRQEWVKLMSNTRARITLTSGGLGPVLDSQGSDHSVFAKAFLESLRNNDGLLQGYSLYAQVLGKMTTGPELAQAEIPEYSPIHLAGHESGEFFFQSM